jgi:MOSC domain-containing protein YiiM
MKKMAFVKLICTSPVAGGESVTTTSVKAIVGRGIEGDRYCEQNTDPARQLTLIESEVIDQFNQETRSELPYAMFRRNLVTEGIQLNSLVGKTFYVGEVKLCGRELCEPCLYLQETLKINDLVKHLIHKGGLCCEILTSGTIQSGDKLSI